MTKPRQESSMPTAAAPASVPDRLPVGDRWTWLVLIPLVSIVIFAFIPSLANGFVWAWDDQQSFLENPHFRGLGAAEVKWAWTTSWLGVYQPLAWMLFETQYFFCQLDPHGYHLTSLVLQVANAVVLYALTVAMLLRCRTDSRSESAWPYCVSAGLATALFAVHPLRVEPVAWASCQPYLPCVLFSMLAVLAYLPAFPRDSSPRWSWLVGSFLLFVVALLFKAVAVSLPVVLLILDYYPLRRIPDETGRWFGASARRVLGEKIPFLLTSLVFMVVAIAVREQSPFRVEPYDASEGIAQACYAIWFYIVKTVLPLDLIAFYPLPKEIDWRSPPYSVSILATVALTGGLVLVRRRWPGLLAAWLSYLVILAPNSGIIRNNSFVIAADRYSFMAMLGAVMLAAGGFCSLWRLVPRGNASAIGMPAIGLGVLLGLAVETRTQCRTWLDSESLWTHAVAHGANSSALAHYNLGTILFHRGQYEAAKAHFTQALGLNPDYDKAHNNLGNILFTEGEYDESVAHFTNAIGINPGYADAHYNLGTVLFRQRNHEEAVTHLTEALRLNPRYAEAHKNLGDVLLSQGKHEPALAHLVEAIRLNPGFADAHNSLGMILFRQKKYAEAEAHFREAIRLRPENAQSHYNLGLVFTQLENFEAARGQFAEAIRLQPGDPKAYNAGAMLMAACPDAKYRNGIEAVRLATRACELTQWKNAIILDTLAAAQAESGDFEAAVKLQKKAIALLTDEAQKHDYRSRLMRYQAKRPYRQRDPRPGPADARPKKNP